MKEEDTPLKWIAVKGGNGFVLGLYAIDGPVIKVQKAGFAQIKTTSVSAVGDNAGLARLILSEHFD